MLKVDEIDPGRMVHLFDEKKNRTVLVLVANSLEGAWVARKPGPITLEVARDEHKDDLINRLQRMYEAKLIYLIARLTQAGEDQNESHEGPRSEHPPQKSFDFGSHSQIYTCHDIESSEGHMTDYQAKELALSQVQKMQTREDDEAGFVRIEFCYVYHPTDPHCAINKVDPELKHD